MVGQLIYLQDSLLEGIFLLSVAPEFIRGYLSHAPDQSIDAVRKEVVNSAGWLLITSKGNDVATLLDTG